jgi:hypothetical protein
MLTLLSSNVIHGENDDLHHLDMYFTQFINTYQDVICSEKRIGIDANHTGDGERILSSIANRVSATKSMWCTIKC